MAAMDIAYTGWRTWKQRRTLGCGPRVAVMHQVLFQFLNLTLPVAVYMIGFAVLGVLAMYTSEYAAIAVPTVSADALFAARVASYRMDTPAAVCTSVNYTFVGGGSGGRELGHGYEHGHDGGGDGSGTGTGHGQGGNTWNGTFVGMTTGRPCEAWWSMVIQTWFDALLVAVAICTAVVLATFVPCVEFLNFRHQMPSNRPRQNGGGYDGDSCSDRCGSCGGWCAASCRYAGQMLRRWAWAPIVVPLFVFAPAMAAFTSIACQKRFRNTGGARRRGGAGGGGGHHHNDSVTSMVSMANTSMASRRSGDLSMAQSSSFWSKGGRSSAASST